MRKRTVVRYSRSQPVCAAAQPRRGTILVIAMMCLLIMSMLSASLLRIALVERQHERSQGQHLQTHWLAESGLQLAALQLRQNPDYEGEVWEIAASELGGTSAGRVEIKVEQVAADESKSGKTSPRRIHVRAEYPVNSPQRKQVSRVIVRPVMTPADPQP